MKMIELLAGTQSKRPNASDRVLPRLPPRQNKRIMQASRKTLTPVLKSNKVGFHSQSSRFYNDYKSATIFDFFPLFKNEVERFYKAIGKLQRS
jgi:hypothetical protein